MRFLLSAFVFFFFTACSAERDAESETGVRISEHTVETADGVTLYYRIAGEGEETVIAPFALFHGNALDSLAKGRRIVTYDPRGRGRSEAAPLERVSLDYLLSDLDTVREAVGAEEVAIIGWSGGGMESFVYALRNPGRVTRLVQLAPVAARFDPYGNMMMEDRRARTDAEARADLQARFDAGEFEGDSARLCREYAAVTNPPMFADPENLPENIPDLCVYENEHPSVIGRYFGKFFESIEDYDWRDRLDEVSIPRLVIHGEKDNVPLEGSKEWVHDQPNARLLIIEDAGHWPHYEQPEETLSAIETFLSGEWPEGAEALPAIGG